MVSFVFKFSLGASKAAAKSGQGAWSVAIVSTVWNSWGLIEMSVVSLPFPPFEMRQLVGPTDEKLFDNPTGGRLFGLDHGNFASVLDFGCGCGRLARQMIMQKEQPRNYVGFDLHAGMIQWCQENLTPHARNFKFVHHDVKNDYFNPGSDKPPLKPMPVDDSSCSLILATSVFTHTVQSHAEYYLREIKRVLSTNGILVGTFFMFEKRYFPMMQDFQNTLYINDLDPWNATIFDREWLEKELEGLGLGVVEAMPPKLRGFQWRLHIKHASDNAAFVSIPQDTAPFGRMPPPVPSRDPSKIGA